MQSQLVPAVTESPSAAIFKGEWITVGREAAVVCGADLPVDVPEMVGAAATTATARIVVDNVIIRFQPIIVAQFS